MEQEARHGESSTFHSILEDVIPVVVDHIKSWAEIQAAGADWKNKSIEGRKWVTIDDGQSQSFLCSLPFEFPLLLTCKTLSPTFLSFNARMRDSTLRGITLTSKEAYLKWTPFLLENVTISPNLTMPSVYLLLKKKPELGKLIKLINMVPNPEEATPGDAVDFMSLWQAFGASAGRRLEPEEAEARILELIFGTTANLQTLVFSGGLFAPPSLVQMVEKKRVPFTFLTQSLKRIVISTSDHPRAMIPAQNAICILVFCLQLRQASLGFTIDLHSFNYLVEYVDTFRGLSKVTQLAITTTFVWDGFAGGVGKWKGSHKKEKRLWKVNSETETVFNFLTVTNELRSLEISASDSYFTSGQKVPGIGIATECLLALTKSQESIKHLRLHQICSPLAKKKEVFRLSVLENLKILCLEDSMIDQITNGYEGTVSTSVEILHLLHYQFIESQVQAATHFTEEFRLLLLIKKNVFPNLKQVFVPSEPINGNGVATSSPFAVTLWKQRRMILENAEVFKGGKVCLKTIKLTETSESNIHRRVPCWSSCITEMKFSLSSLPFLSRRSSQRGKLYLLFRLDLTLSSMSHNFSPLHCSKVILSLSYCHPLWSSQERVEVGKMNDENVLSQSETETITFDWKRSRCEKLFMIKVHWEKLRLSLRFDIRWRNWNKILKKRNRFSEKD